MTSSSFVHASATLTVNCSVSALIESVVRMSFWAVRFYSLMVRRYFSVFRFGDRFEMERITTTSGFTDVMQFFGEREKDFPNQTMNKESFSALKENAIATTGNIFGPQPATGVWLDDDAILQIRREGAKLNRHNSALIVARKFCSGGFSLEGGILKFPT